MSNVNIWLWVLALIIAYLLGNISPSTLLAKAKGIDIHKEGSGNAGTTNALRVMGKTAGVITLVVDVLKGTISVLISKRMSVGSITGAVVFPFISMFMERDFLYIGIVLAIIILVKHRANIKRLLQGKEPVMSIFEKKKTSDGQED